MGTKVTGISIILASLTQGAWGLDGALVGVISSSTLAALVLVVIFAVIVTICFQWEKETEEKSKHAKGKYVQNGAPRNTKVPNGRQYVPKPYLPHSRMPIGMVYGSHRGTPTMMLNGSGRGMEPGPFPMGSHRGVPPGMMAGMPMPQQGGYSAMNPFFLRPVIYIDESDDEDSYRSTVKEKKKRYRRSFNKEGVPSSSVVIKEMDNTEGGKTTVPNEESRPQPDLQPFSSHDNQEKPKSPKKIHEPRIVPIPQESFTKSESGDEEAQIDEMFAFSVHAKEGDISFNASEPTPPPRRSPVRRSPSPVIPPPPVEDSEKNYHFASVISQNEEADPSITAYVEDRSNDVYASVIRSTKTRSQSEPNPLSRSMAERLEDIVQKRHDGWPTEFDEGNEDENYPPEDYGDDLSPTSETSDKRFDTPTATTAIGYEPDPPSVSLRQSRQIPATKYGGPATTNEGQAGSMKHAFTNQVLRELQMRQGTVGDDDVEDRNGRAVNFSEQPPEIIPSPRTSMNADLPVITPGVIPPAPPPPPPPPLSRRRRIAGRVLF